MYLGHNIKLPVHEETKVFGGMKLEPKKIKLAVKVRRRWKNMDESAK